MRREPSHDRRVACTEVLIMRGGRRRGEDGNGGKCRGTRRAVPRSAPPRPVPAPPAASSPLPAPSPSLPLPPPFCSVRHNEFSRRGEKTKPRVVPALPTVCGPLPALGVGDARGRRLRAGSPTLRETFSAQRPRRRCPFPAPAPRNGPYGGAEAGAGAGRGPWRLRARPMGARLGSRGESSPPGQARRRRGCRWVVVKYIYLLLETLLCSCPPPAPPPAHPVAASLPPHKRVQRLRVPPAEPAAGPRGCGARGPRAAAPRRPPTAAGGGEPSGAPRAPRRPQTKSAATGSARPRTRRPPPHGRRRLSWRRTAPCPALVGGSARTGRAALSLRAVRNPLRSGAADAASRAVRCGIVRGERRGVGAARGERSANKHFSDSLYFYSSDRRVKHNLAS